MKYTPIFQKNNSEIFQIEKGMLESPSWDITRFAIQRFKIRPFRYQHLLFKALFEKKKIIICKSRQIGISTAIEIAAIYAAVNNTFPSGIHNNTKIGIVSKSNEQAKKVLLDIKKFLILGDQIDDSHPFENLIDNSRFAPQTMYQINLKNKCFIKCFPPTDAIRGEALDIVFIDEGAFIEDSIYFDSIEPTTSKTNGKIIIASTPNGQKGYFFEMFDPSDQFKTHEFTRFWFHWKQVEDPIQRKIIRQKMREAKEKGNLKNFEQEYNAMFTVDEEAFFDNNDVNNAVNHSLAMEYEWKLTPCSLGVDYGQVKAATCLTVMTKFHGKIRILFQWAEKEFDENLLMDNSFEHSIPNLMKRYDIRSVLVDDCSQGYRTNRQLENEGYPVKRIVFSAGRNSMGIKNQMFYNFRGVLKKGLVEFPEIPSLIAEMKSLMEVRMKITTSITSPDRMNDDRIDSAVMASIPFIELEGDFETIVVEANSANLIERQFNQGRVDSEWERLKESSPDISKLVYEHNKKMVKGYDERQVH